MSVVLTIDLPASEFDLGRVIESIDGVHVELQSAVPLGDVVMPLLEVHDREHDYETFAERLREHPAVASVVIINREEDVGCYAVEWTRKFDSFYRSIGDPNATVLSGVKDGDRWQFDLLFPSHDALKAFRRQVDEEGIDLRIQRVSRTRRPIPDPRDGLSAVQREALDLAISRSYYSIPRETTTAELAEELDISDQAVIERLRRATRTLGEEYIAASIDGNSST
ncbi:helix-turn-helix domain-containing protein [Halalkalicoccus subterraneus]|uniref:helix-turn-helix domain-containing protein n=1 Tax=Halalkalicoccus subterraneus TaxID=2675002 RepID=UPI000EFA9C2F|nr:helix-turn-helix domain-containing protein [Halalkalicoccus subterraneus]